MDFDTERLVQNTEALDRRLDAKFEESRGGGELDLQQPLFTQHTYTVDQIAGDQRLKIENALRRANMHMTDYAREVISNAAPPTQPRKDTKSQIFKPLDR